MAVAMIDFAAIYIFAIATYLRGIGAWIFKNCLTYQIELITANQIITFIFFCFHIFWAN